jgi:putative redox protein
MEENRVTIRWVERFQFVGTDSASHSVVLDASPPSGESTGMRPMDMLLLSLGVCTAMDIVQGLKKHGKSLERLEVSVTGTKNESLPHYFKNVNVHYKVYGKGIEPTVLEKVIRQSHELFCSVGATMSGRAEIGWSYEIRESFDPLSF